MATTTVRSREGLEIIERGLEGRRGRIRCAMISLENFERSTQERRLLDSVAESSQRWCITVNGVGSRKKKTERDNKESKRRAKEKEEKRGRVRKREEEVVEVVEEP